MTQTIADRLMSIHEAERRVSGLTPYSAAWADAQRVAVRARADYWQAMGQNWDLSHRPRTDLDLPEWLW